MTSATPSLIPLHVDGPYDGTGFARRLAALADTVGQPDSYGEGAIVSECEAKLARLLGKERAILFSTGTLANTVALSRLATRHARRVLMHPESHVFNDTGDSLAAVAGLTPVAAHPAGPGFGPEEISKAIADAERGKVPQRLAAVVVETPVRRRFNEMFPPHLLAQVVEAGRRHGVPLHLDGARLPIAAAACGLTMAAFSAGFDTIYLSLWKMLGLPFGAVLAGPAHIMEGVELDRRRYGGALPQFWPIAAVVHREIGGLEDAWKKTLNWKRRLEGQIATGGALEPGAVGAEETNTFWLDPKAQDVSAFKERCRERGILLGDIVAGRVLVRVNPQVLRQDANEVAEALSSAVGDRHT
jgi:threonine aldolase